jgi:serpin B
LFRDLIPAGAFDEGTKSVLVNAAYFKGSWKSQFEAEETKKNNFYVKRDKVRLCDLHNGNPNARPFLVAAKKFA